MRVPTCDRTLGGGRSLRPAAWFITALVSLGALSACDFHGATAPGTVFTLEVIPDRVTLQVGGTQQFIAVGRDADGIEIEISPTWSVENSGGTIHGSGGFTAGGTTGTFDQTVQVTSGGLTANSTVTVVVGPLASITVTPDPETLAVGETQQFTAVGRDVGGNIVEISPTWTIENGGGSVGASGLFTAGDTPGTYVNTVTAGSGGLSGDATVVVTAGPLASIEVIPHPVTMGIDDTQQFIAVGRDAGGNLVVIDPVWSIVNGGGTIDASGRFTAGSNLGTFTNTVQATSGGLSGHATVTVLAGELASITVTPNPDTLTVNGTQQFTAVGRDLAGKIVPISPTWSVVNGGGSIDASGIFTAGTTPGTHANTVRATAGGLSGYATVVVTAGALASLTVTPDPVAMVIDATQQFTAVGRDSEGNVIPISPTWSVVNGGGTVSASGVFTAGMTPGEYPNTVRATSGGLSDEATVTVLAGNLASITVTPDPVTLPVNGTQQFTAVGRDSGGNVVPISPTWSVENGGGIVNASGMFTAGNTPGTFSNTVRATSGSISGDATVTVLAGELASITVTPNPDTLTVNGTQQFTAVGRDSEGNVIPIVVAWSVVNGGGSIDGSGLFTAGTTSGTYANTVRATSGGISDEATVTVTPGPLASITVTPEPDTTVVNQTKQFTAVGRDSEGNVIPIAPTWSVVNGGGTVNTSGLFTAGTTAGTYANTVRATSGGISDEATVTVTPGPLASITVTPDPETTAVNQTQQFTSVGRDSEGNVIPIVVAWSVENGGGSIDSSGLFTAGNTPGTFSNTVRATSGSISGDATVTVLAGELASITVTPNPDTLTVNGTQQFTAVGRDSEGNVIPIVVAWSVVNGGGSIDASGMFTAGTTPGTYANTVRATAGGLSGYATVVVTAGALASLTVTPDPVAMVIDATQQFTAVGRDSEGNVIPISPTWSVENGGGTINASGMFTAGTTPGTYANTVVATSGSTSGDATVTVTPGPLASITVRPDPDTTAVNQTQQFTAVGRDSEGNVIPISPTWSVVNGGGTINTSGMFTAGTTAGTYANTVRATSGGISDDATVTVTPGPLASITVTPDPVTLPVNGTQQFTAVGRDSGGNIIPISPTWSVVNGGGTINASGMFTAGTTAGTYANTVVATSGSTSGDATVTVTPGPLASITVTPDPDTTAVNQTQQFTAVGRDSEGNVIPISPTWSVVNGGGTVNTSGLFTAGTTSGTFSNTVVATSGSIFGDATVTVAPGPLASITVTPDPDTTAVNQTQQFTAVGRDSDGNVIPISPTWSVVNGGGTITASGVFTAGNTAGTFSNTARATSDGISGFATVVVTAPPPSPSTFRVLAASSVACSGGSITGDVGTSSSAGTIAGCNIIDGTAETGSLAAVQAFDDFVAEYDARELVACGTTLTGTLAGVSLAPGVYCFDAAATVTGVLTLDGPSNGVWLIKVGTTGVGALTGTNFDVVMAGGGQACNVTWWVEDATTMTDSTLKGRVLSGGKLEMTRGTLDGDAWSQGAVAITGTVLTDCAP